MKKPVTTVVLLILDTILLLVILFWPKKISQSEITETIVTPGSVQEEATSVEPEESSAKDDLKPSGEKPEDGAIADPVTETAETESYTETAETEQILETTEEKTASGTTETKPADESTESKPSDESTEVRPEEEITADVSAFDTSDRPTIKDFKWITDEIRAGRCPEEAESFYFEESLGGWKCYVVDDETGTERLANMELNGSEEDLDLRFDWYYTRISKDEVFEDNSPDSLFKGNVTEEGEIDAQGSGKLHLTDIYRIGDHQYAFGWISWPDGMSGRLYLVRP